MSFEIADLFEKILIALVIVTCLFLVKSCINEQDKTNLEEIKVYVANGCSQDKYSRHWICPIKDSNVNTTNNTQ